MTKYDDMMSIIGILEDVTGQEAAKFHVQTERDRLVGKWAARQMGLKGEAADRYVAELIHSSFEGFDENDMARKLELDFAYHGLPVSSDVIHKKISWALGAAKVYVKGK